MAQILPSSATRLALLVTDPITARSFLRGQLSHLSRSGFDVRLVSSPGPMLDEVCRSESVVGTAVPMRREISPLRDLGSLFRLYRALREMRPAAVNASTPKAGLLGLLAATLSGVPRRVYTVRGLRLETTRGATRTVLRLAERLAVACADQVVFVSHSVRRVYVAEGLVRRERTVVLGDGSSNGVDLDRFRPPSDDAERLAIRRRFGLAPESEVIGFVGRLVRDKGIEELARAFIEQVLPERPRARMLVVGDYEKGDPVAADVRAMLADTPAVRLAGFVDDVAPVYRAIDVLAFPSFREGFPNVPLEAAASAVPTVGFAATGTRDAVVHGRTGTLVPVGDTRALGAALNAMLGDPARRAVCGAAARKRAVASFSQQTVWRAWTDFYKALLVDDGSRGRAGS